MEMILMKEGNTLVAADPVAENALQTIKRGSFVKVKLTIPRSIQHHRLFFAIIKMCYEAQNEPKVFATEQDLLDVIKIGIGHCREVKDLHGRTHFVTRSIDFATMDQYEFKQFFERAMDFIFRNLLQIAEDRELERQICNALQIATYER